MVVFAASRESVAAMAGIRDSLARYAVQVIGVCHEKATRVESYARKQRLSVLILADVTGEVSALYGLWDAVHGSTIAGYVLVDPHGVVRALLRGRSMPPGEITDLVAAATGHS